MRRWLALVLVGIFMMVGVVGCGSKTQTINSPGNTTQNQTETKTQSGNDLSSIMKSASQVKGMSFDMLMTVTSTDGKSVTSNGKMYVQDQKIRMEIDSMGVKMITLMKTPGEVYMYNPDTKSAMKITTPQQGAKSPNSWAKESGDTTGLTVVGEETRDGYNCLVVTVADSSNTKMWIRKDIGMPIRVESKSAEGNMVMEYKNYNLAAQPDSLFDLPAGTQITTMPNLPNMPNAGQ